jgi:hypothetical protein
MSPAAPDLLLAGASPADGGPPKRQRTVDVQTVKDHLNGNSWEHEENFSQEGRKRRMPALRSLITAFTGVPGVIGLHGGFPPADAFPFESISVKLRDGSSFEISEPSKVLVFNGFC